jgi:integrase
MSLLYKRPGSPYFYVTRTRQSTGTSNRKLAEEFARKAVTEAWRRDDLGEETHTWGQLTETWLDLKAHKKSLDRDEFITDDFKAFLIKRDLHAVDLHDLPKDICRKYGALVKARASASTANRHLACLRSMFNQAVDNEWLDKCPQIEFYHVVKDEPRWLTPAEFETIQNALPEGFARDIATLGLQTGMRFSNVAGLRWDWITADGAVAIVPATSAKTERTYTVPLSTKARAVIDRWKDKQSGPYVIHRDGERVKSIRFWWERACTDIGIECRVHDLRHTFTSWHLQNKTPDRVIQEMCGWASPAMLQNYGHLATSHLTEYADNHNTATDTKKL